MYTYDVIHDKKNRIGDTIYRFQTEKKFPVELVDGQLDRLAVMLDIDFDLKDDTLTIREIDNMEITTLTEGHVKFVLTGAKYLG